MPNILSLPDELLFKICRLVYWEEVSATRYRVRPFAHLKPREYSIVLQKTAILRAEIYESYPKTRSRVGLAGPTPKKLQVPLLLVCKRLTDAAKRSMEAIVASRAVSRKKAKQLHDSIRHVTYRTPGTEHLFLEAGFLTEKAVYSDRLRRPRRR